MTSSSNNLAARLLEGQLSEGRGDSVAIREGEREMTFDGLLDAVRRFATALRALRVSPGERVAIFMPDSIEAVVSVLGTVYSGAVAVPLSELGRANDIRDRLNDSGAALAVVHGSLAETVDVIKTEAPNLREVVVVGDTGPGERDFNSLVRGAMAASHAEEVAADDTALILYSAGARASEDDIDTAEVMPTLRGVPHSHAAPLAAAERFATHFALDSSDRVLSVVRLSTAYGLGAGLLYPLYVGAEALLLAEQPHTSAILETIESFAPTVFLATPSVYRSLSRDAAEANLQAPLASLRCCISGAENMPLKVAGKIKSALGADVTVGYGLTEAFEFVIAGSVSSGKGGSCGRALPGFEFRIVDDSGNETGPMEIGTLLVRGGTIAQSYWGEDDATSGDGWFATRDRFMVDNDGYYYHCGRVDDLFKVGGKWVWPGEVERALMAHEAVWDCAVVGADDEDGLIKPQAFVVANIGHDPGPELTKTLRAYVKNELAPYKYPRWIEFVDELPKGPSGKVLRYKLRDRLKGSRGQRRAETAAE